MSWRVKEYEVGDKSPIRLWVVKPLLSTSGERILIKMEDGELEFFVKEFVDKIRV